MKRGYFLIEDSCLSYGFRGVVNLDSNDLVLPWGVPCTLISVLLVFLVF